MAFTLLADNGFYLVYEDVKSGFYLVVPENRKKIKESYDKIYISDFPLFPLSAVLKYDFAAKNQKRLKEIADEHGGCIKNKWNFDKKSFKMRDKMSYRETQRKWSKSLLGEFINDKGNGLFNGKEYSFVLQNPELNLWEGIREDSMLYFIDNNISWWESGKFCPTGHLLSSQVACINHLYALRQRQDLATAVLRNIDNDIISAEIIDDGYVEFEVIGKENYLGERHHIRGANSTSVDALMMGKKEKSNILIFIEWKYTECYDSSCLFGTDEYHPRPDTYNKLLEEECSPIKKSIRINDEEPYKALYYEPYYQLMRQTLLAWKMTNAIEYGANDYIHIHIVPDENNEMLNSITSKELRFIKSKEGIEADNMECAWKNVLVDNNKYKRISPQNFLRPLREEKDINSLLKYLNWRYWQ